MSDHPTPSSPPASLATLASVVGVFLIFLLILLIAYLPKQAEPITQGALSPAERKAKLDELRAHEQKTATTYAWIDQAKGTVQLPLDRAMELVVQEHNPGK
jgi:hypothetical protein